MLMPKQTTINTSFTLAGPGLHTGRLTHATLLPADANTGILLRRSDLAHPVDIPALADFVVDTNHGTTVGKDGATVSTIEHLMSALHGLQVDNAIVEVDGPEIPILDGSAYPWVQQIAKVGLRLQETDRRCFVLVQPVEWRDDSANILLRAEPADHFSVDSTIIFSSQLIGCQSAQLDSFAQYPTDFAHCRTFVFLHEVEFLLAHNLIKGGDLDNALVFVDHPLADDAKERLASLFGRDKESLEACNGVLNTIEPYFPNEPARHKLLDFMGDIYLVGQPVQAHFTLRCPGHHANTELARLIRAQLLKKI